MAQLKIIGEITFAELTAINWLGEVEGWKMEMKVTRLSGREFDLLIEPVQFGNDYTAWLPRACHMHWINMEVTQQQLAGVTQEMVMATPHQAIWVAFHQVLGHMRALYKVRPQAIFA